MLIITHGKMSDGMMDSVELIMGKQENYKTLNLCHGDDIQLFAEKIQHSITGLDTGDGVLVLVDLFGASPYNQAAISYRELKDHKYRLVSGVSLPMVLEAFSQRQMGTALDEIYLKVMEAAKEGIKEFFDLQNNKND